MHSLRSIASGATKAAVLWLLATAAALVGPVPAAADTRWGADYFPNVTFTTQDGRPVRFYDDLIKGKIVAINLIYTTCQYACPLETARMAQVQRLLGDRMGRDVFFYSITIDPEHDTPAVLKDYAEKYHAGPGWEFLTGTKADIDLVSRKLGLYTPPDPARNPDGHMPYLLVGNEATGQWMRNSATDNAKFLANTIGDWLNSWQTQKKKALQTYAEVPTLTFDKGQYTFASHCAACHTVGAGDRIGPDLHGVTAARDRRWLTRMIVEPDKLMGEGDATALSLLEKYKQVRMPNLDLTDEDAAAVLAYLDAQSRVVPAAAAAPAAAPANAATPTTSDLDLKPLLEPYLAMHRALSLDSTEGVSEAAQGVSAEAARLGAAGEPLQAAVAKLPASADVKVARAVFGKLSDAILALAKESNAAIGDEVRIAYCPMVQKSWLQRGDRVQNPFYGKSMSECGRITSASAAGPR